MGKPVMRFSTDTVAATVYDNRKTGRMQVKLSYIGEKTDRFEVFDLPAIAILAEQAFRALSINHGGTR